MSKTETASEKDLVSYLKHKRNRGGSWTFSIVGSRFSYRFIDYAGYRFDLLGFRLVEVTDE